jgi:peptidyl-prolyl cis-trans isomerase D
MAVIGTIRNRFGVILLVFIGFALAAFVLGDFFKSANKMRQSDRNLMGEVDGEKIYYSQFDQKLTLNLENEKRRSRKENLTNDEIFRVKEQTWNQIVEEIIMGKERAELGIDITADELLDLMQGDDPHPYVKQSFKDPQTGEYDPEQVRNILKNLETFTPQQQEQWFNFQDQVKTDWLNKKYNSLISSGYTFPTPFVEKDFDEKKTNATVRILAYRTNNKQKIEVSDQDYQKYYDEYKENYRRKEELRDLKYVIFQVNPSNDDRVATQKLVQEIATDFKKSNNAFLFANSESESSIDTNWHKKGDFDISIDNIVFNNDNAKAGTFIAPYFQNKIWKMGKVVKIAMRSDSLKASHILISYAGARNADPKKVTRIKVQAKSLADSIYNVLKASPNRMEELMSNSDDPSADQNKGDLGWFKDGAMVPSFNEAVANAEVGDILLVESQFGYHIIKVAGKTAPIKKAKIAIITKELVPSRETNERVFADASDFQIKAVSPKVFDTLSKSLGLGIRKAPDLTKMSARIPGLSSARHVVQWAFREDTKVNDVSEVYSFDDKYVVFLLESIKPAGLPTLDELKANIKTLVTKAIKVKNNAKILNEKIGSGDIYSIAASLDLKVDTIPNINFAMRSVPRFGKEEKLMGAIFAAEPKKLSKVIEGDNAAFLFVVDEFVTPSADAKKDIYKSQLVNTFKRKLTTGEIINALKKKVEINENRKNFY